MAYSYRDMVYVFFLLCGVIPSAILLATLQIVYGPLPSLASFSVFFVSLTVAYLCNKLL